MEYTKEDLINTWGIVESKEHAEVIAELARSAGIITSDTWNNAHDYFSINYNGLLFWTGKSHAESRGEKQITIPLPPETKAEKPDLSKPPKHFDCVCNKCGGKCCIGNCDEWPQVGDEIVTRGGGNGILIVSKPDKDSMVVCNFYGEYALVYFDELQKPKSKQDLLIEDLHQKLLTNNCKDYYLLACDIVQGKIKGLSYNT